MEYFQRRRANFATSTYLTKGQKRRRSIVNNIAMATLAGASGATLGGTTSEVRAAIPNLRKGMKLSPGASYVKSAKTGAIVGVAGYGALKGYQAARRRWRKKP